MPRPALHLRNLLRRLNDRLIHPHALTFLPALMLGGYWYGGEGLLIIAAIAVPTLLLIAQALDSAHPDKWIDPLTGLANRALLVETIASHLAHFAGKERSTIVFAIQIDDFSEIVDSLGSAGAREVLRKTADRIVDMLRPDDTPARLVEHRFGVVLGPLRKANLDIGLQVSERIQAAIAEPFSIGGATVHVSASVGLCLGRRSPAPGAEALLTAAEIALDEARRAGRGAIRAFSPEMTAAVERRHALETQVASAFEDGQIQAWFQPQISTDTGMVSGFETLARWVHPERGVIEPSEFLDAAEIAGLSERLGELMLFRGLSALRFWDRAGFRVPRIAFNFSAAELRNPRLVDRIRWELDRFDLTPDRLNVEILESVVVESENDTIIANIAALAALGCQIDLDDFGTRHASISNIRRFAVSRIKIDRSFVRNVDSEREQRRLVTAILSMAQQLDLETIAEGVETIGEHAMMAQLGCNHVQGFSVARPMPVDETPVWMERHMAKLGAIPGIDRSTS
ncbi:putative bifunctional diguanylate cyclase/phosphodiesterase [Tropicimonas sp.]|uniref:putative bifunctional diguanylate cyclase/phosphodiesterase n=1 Tax=Tropicimonas sp. TaxID=2067044 RepID=UPI003A8B12A1